MAYTVYYDGPDGYGPQSFEADTFSVDAAGHLIVGRRSNLVAAFPPGKWHFIQETSTTSE